MKPFPTYLKEKERYVVFTVESAGKPDRKTVINSICSAVLDYAGEATAARAGFRVVEYDENLQKGILRAGTENLEEVIAGLAMLERIGQEPASIITQHVSGTLKKARAEDIKTLGLFTRTND